MFSSLEIEKTIKNKIKMSDIHSLEDNTYFIAMKTLYQHFRQFCARHAVAPSCNIYI